MRYFLHIAYDGSLYRGWQKQLKVNSIQETIEEKLEKIFKKVIQVYGCGRTDAGVHASQYILHIDIEEEFDFDLKFYLNNHLPNSIVVFDIIKVKPNNHARFDASSRTYDYFIHLFNDPVLDNYSSYYELENLDFESMKKGAEILPLYNDFITLCKRPDQYDNSICKVTDAMIFINEEQNRIRFTITANRFLQGMIRLCVYNLLKIGTKEITVVEFENLLKNRIFTDNKKLAKPNGLYLSKIEYPYLKLDANPSFCGQLKLGLEG